MSVKETRYDWTDLGYSGVVQVDQYVARWRILDLVDEDTPAWWPAGEASPFPPTEDPALAEVVVEIDVKWDGCANYSWNDQVATHSCDGGEALATMIRRVNDTSKELLPAARP